jgi:hypothetical protein
LLPEDLKHPTEPFKWVNMYVLSLIGCMQNYLAYFYQLPSTLLWQ